MAAIVPHHRARPRKPCPETFDMLDVSRIPASRKRELTPPRFATVIAEHGYTELTDRRSNFVRYIEDCLLPAVIARKKQSAETMARETLRACKFWEHLCYLETGYIEAINQQHDDAAYLATYLTQSEETRILMAEAVKAALKAYHYAKAGVDEDLAMLLEIPYMALRGSKSLVIIATRRSTFYGKWARKYPHLWTVHKGPTAEALTMLDAEDEEDADDLELRPGFRARLLAEINHGLRPIWWGDLNLGPFSRICRQLVKIRKKERKKRLHTPAMLYQWRTRPKPNEALSPRDDYRT
jgi:hypothetical protein